MVNHGSSFFGTSTPEANPSSEGIAMRPDSLGQRLGDYSDLLLSEVIARLKQPSTNKRHAKSVEGIAAAEDHVDSFCIIGIIFNGNDYVRCGGCRQIRYRAGLPYAWKGTQPNQNAIEEAGDLGRCLVNSRR
jgi:hypothetical protein